MQSLSWSTLIFCICLQVSLLSLDRPPLTTPATTPLISHTCFHQQIRSYTASVLCVFVFFCLILCHWACRTIQHFPAWRLNLNPRYLWPMHVLVFLVICLTSVLTLWPSLPGQPTFLQPGSPFPLRTDHAPVRDLHQGRSCWDAARIQFYLLLCFYKGCSLQFFFHQACSRLMLKANIFFLSL